MSDLAPETREEAYLYALANDGTVSLTPRTRKEALLKCAIEGRLPDFEPHTRKEAFLHALCMRNAGGGSGGGGNTEKVVVLKETTLTFLPHPTLGAYMATNVPLFQLEEGKSYTAVWAGTEYVCVAKTESFSGMTAVAIGNKAMLGIGENTGEPFIIFYIPDQQVSSMISTDTEETDRAVAIYQNGGSGGSDSSDLVKYVTFKSCDGSEEYFKMPVLKGDDCKDPINHGDIETPIKPSTNTKEYTHSGWSLTANGLADSAALTNVTSDRVVYASFEESVRYYTVRFYTDPGVLYETVQVTYGGTAEPTVKPEKEGVVLDGWSPSNVNITADTDCMAVWLEAITFAASTWADIARVCEAGEASKYFTVGEIRDIAWTNKAGNTITTQLQIIGINHDDLADGSGKAGITAMFVPLIDMTSYTNTNPTLPYLSAAWDACVCRTQLEFLYGYLPADLKTNIKQVKKISSNTKANNFGILETTDKLWVPSVTEMFGTSNKYGDKIAEGVQYELFKTTENRKKYLQSKDGVIAADVSAYGLRSVSGWSQATSYRYAVDTDGTEQKNNGNVLVNHAVGFCI